MPLQVIGGEARGRRLKSPPGGARPTAALVRRSLFDILGASVVGARVLDLYAGAGTLGIEALSRGAASCEFVERDRRCANVIASNLKAIDASSRGRAHCAPVGSWLRRQRERLREFDLILIDPPYGDSGITPMLNLLAAPLTLAPGTLVVVEGPASHDEEGPAGLSRLRRVRHGDTALTILEATT
jgi:16S rRNA (guanine966-N2)-methyltransferase